MIRHRALLTCLLTALLATPLFATWEDGVAAFRAGRFEDATAVFQSFVSRSPAAPEGHYMLGLSLLRQKRLAEALGPLGEALALGPDDLRYRLTLTQALIKARKPDDAFDVLKVLDPAAVAEPSRASFNQLLAKAATSSGRDSDAFNSLGRALATDGGSKVLWLARANLASRLDRPEDAFSALATAFKLDPSDPQPGYNAVHTALTIAQDPAAGERKQEWYDQAAGVANRLAGAFPTPENLRLAGSASMGAREYEKALGYFESLLATSGQDPLLHYDLGRCRLALGQSREALDHFTAALERSPDADLFAAVHAKRGAALRVLEQFAGAAEAFRLAGDDAAAEEMDRYAKNRLEVAAATADCVEKRTTLEQLLKESTGLEHTPEYRQLKEDLAAINAACSSYFSEFG